MNKYTPGLLSALRAIIARINGIFDDPDLMAFGPLSINTESDILCIAEKAIAKTESERATSETHGEIAARLSTSIKETNIPLANANNELLAALKDQIEPRAKGWKVTDWGIRDANARAAIAKAEGETP